jgi:hypothetical protein
MCGALRGAAARSLRAKMTERSVGKNRMIG